LQADIFSKYTSQKIDKYTVAKCIVFEELHETIVGDVPEFTSQELAKALYKTEEEKLKREVWADGIIAEHLTGELKKEFGETIRLVHEEKDVNVRFFRQVDKTDPIIGIWRYIHLFRKTLDIEKFLEAMTDFFTNPKVKTYCIDTEIENLRAFLQNKANAREFFNKGFEDYSGKMSRDDLKMIFERPMHFI
jgi:5'-deoxynucleotidase YfbR-like HD superfamily hydrolase